MIGTGLGANDSEKGRLEGVSRVLDVLIAASAVVLLAPLMTLIALRILADRSGSVLYRQERVGRGGVPIVVHKFRTLRAVSDRSEIEVAADGDPRITHPGRWLRRSRLDELPQLFDVIAGRMALVGPRPETRANLVFVPAELCARRHLLRPGITSRVALRYLAEDAVLAGLSDPLEAYRRVIVPAKVAEDVATLSERSIVGDLKLLLRTPCLVLSRGARRRSRVMIEALLRAQMPNG